MLFTDDPGSFAAGASLWFVIASIIGWSFVGSSRSNLVRNDNNVSRIEGNESPGHADDEMSPPLCRNIVVRRVCIDNKLAGSVRLSSSRFGRFL
jgi:hypothetical protein